MPLLESATPHQLLTLKKGDSGTLHSLNKITLLWVKLHHHQEHLVQMMLVLLSISTGKKSNSKDG